MAVEQVQGFPSDFVSKEEKLKESYGLQYFNAMWSIDRNNFYGQNEQRGRYILNRKFAEGLQDINEMKQFMSIDGDLSYLNLDFRPINRIATVVDNMVGMITNQIYKIKCTPSDTVSKSKFDKERNKLIANILLAKVLAENRIPERTGINPLAGQKVLENDDEVELYMKMNFKTEEALAMELALKWVFDNNNFDKESVPKMVRDLIVDKKTALYRYYDDNRNIRVERFDHIDILTPYSKDDRFRKITYQGLLKQYTIGEISKLNPKLTDKDLYYIAMCYAGKNKNPLWNSSWSTSYEGYYNTATFAGARPWVNFMITVMHGYFLTPIKETTKLVKHKKSRTSKVSVVRGEEGADFKVVDAASTTKIYRMEGMWIPDSEYIWNYGMSFNIERDVILGGYSPECELPCVMIAPNIYDMQNKSIVERCIPFERQMNLSYLKLQQFKIAATPAGIAIDERGLDIADEKGQGSGKQKHTEKLKQYRQTGSFTYYGWDDMNNQLINIPFKEMQGGMTGGEIGFINDINLNVDMINKVIGFNSSVDATTPSGELAVGNAQMAQQSTYNCMKPIISAVIDPINRTAKRVALMVQDSVKLNNRAFIESIGQSNVDILTIGKGIAFSTENIQIEMMPDYEEQKELRDLIALGIQTGVLMPSDVLQIQMQMKTDVTLAGQLLVMLEEKNRKAKMEESNMAIQQNGQTQQQSLQMAAQIEQQRLQMEIQGKTTLLQTEWQLKGQYSSQEFQQQMELQRLKNLGTSTVAEIGADSKTNVQVEANKAKTATALIQSQTMVAKEHIIHSSKIQENHQLHDQAKELSENEPPEAVEEDDTNEKRYIVGNKAYKESVLKKHGHDVKKLKEYK